MHRDISDLTLLTVDLIDIVRKCTTYDFHIRVHDEFVKTQIVRRKIKLYYRTEEILTMIVNIKDEVDYLDIGMIKLIFKNKQSQTVYLKDMPNCLLSNLSEHKIEDYSLSVACSIIVDRYIVIAKHNSNITNISLNNDLETGSKYFTITYAKGNQVRNFGYNSDLLKLYNKKFRGKQAKIVKW